MMQTAGLCSVVALAACSSVFDLEPVTLDDSALGDSEKPAFCAVPAVFDTFDGSTPCSFGAPSIETRMVQANGVLTVNMPANTLDFVGCTAFQAFPFTERGVFLQVVEAPTANDLETILDVRNHPSATPAFKARMRFFNGQLQFFANGMARGATTSAPRWWWLHRVGTGMTVAAEVSSNGASWTELGRADIAMSSSIAVDVLVGATGSNPPARAVFGSFGICN